MIIGVTGGVGCGKSAVMDMLKNEFGAEIILADNVGHEVMEPKEDAYLKIVEHFGADMIDDDGAIDRKKLPNFQKSAESIRRKWQKRRLKLQENADF